MKRKIKITIVLVSLFFLILPLNQRMVCEEESPTISWKFEPHTDGYIHVEAGVHLMQCTDSYIFLELSDEVMIKNLKAYEYESGIPIEHKFLWEKGKQAIMLIFSQPVPEPLSFGIEFDLVDLMEEKNDKVFVFEWWYRSEEEKSHTAVVFLPKGSELLDLQLLEPTKVEEGEQGIIYYEGISKGYNDFSFQLVFSSSAKAYMGMGMRYEESGDYDAALSYYERAISIYGRYSYYVETKPEIYRELRERILSVQKIRADNMVEEATEAFSQEEYEKARSLFEEAQILYRALKETEKESECREMIAECERFGAGAQLEQGKMHYEGEDSLVQAEDRHEEPGDTEKVFKYEERAVNLQFICQNTFICILGIMVVLVKVQKYPPKIKKVFQFLSLAGISLFGLGILFKGIFLTVGAFSAFCIITVWVGYHYRRNTLGMSDSSVDCFISSIVTYFILGGILLLSMGAILLVGSDYVKILVFCVYFSFFLWVILHSYAKWGFWRI